MTNRPASPLVLVPLAAGAVVAARAPGGLPLEHPMTPLCFLDTECDGVHPGRKVWEVAMIRRDDHGADEASFFVEIDLSTADPFGLKVGRYYERHPLGRYLAGPRHDLSYPRERYDTDSDNDDGDDGYVSQSLAALRVAQWTHGAHIVGAVPNFDTEVLAALLRGDELTPAWHYHLIDVETLAVGWLRARASELDDRGQAHAAEDVEAVLTLPWDSEALSRACGVEPASDEERHTALGDARHAMRLYDAITGGGLVKATTTYELTDAGARHLTVWDAQAEHDRWLAGGAGQ